MVGLKDVTGALQCILLGAKDSVLGIWPVFQLIKKYEDGVAHSRVFYIASVSGHFNSLVIMQE